MKYLPEVDGLRAVAVLSVVAYHAGLGGSGYVGVDVFFVISGYLITRLLAQDGDLLSFYARRARRILPAAILVTLATLGLSALLLPDPGEVALSASAAAIFGANFWFQRLDYWASDTQPLLHLWSLSVEEQFYLLWPFVLLLSRRNSMAVVATVAVLSLVLYAGLSVWHPSAAFYQMPARAWELAAGGLIALAKLPRRDDVAGGVESLPLHVGGLAPRDSYAVAACVPYDPADLRGFAAGSHGAGGSEGGGREGNAELAVRRNGASGSDGSQVAVLNDAVFANTDLAIKPLPLAVARQGGAERRSQVVLETVSHPNPRARLYGPASLRNIARAILQHGSHIGLAVIGLALLPWPVYVAQPLAVLGATLVIASVHVGHRSVLSARPLVWVGLISYSLYLWHWPLLAIDRALRVGESPLSVRLALCGVAGVLAALTYRYVETPFRRARVRPARAIALGVTCAAALSCTAFVMTDTKPAPVADLRCGAGLQAPHCVTGRSVVLWGDSFGDAWRGYVQGIARERGLPAVRLGRSGCPPTLAPTKIRGMEANDYACGKNTREAVDWLRTHEVDTLVVTARWSRLDDAGRDGVLQWARQLPGVRRIVVVGAQPELRDAIEKCLRLNVPCDITRAEYDSATQGTKRMTAELAKLPNVEVLEIGDWMCDADKCRGVRDGMVLFRHDNHHASSEAVEAFVRSY